MTKFKVTVKTKSGEVHVLKGLKRGSYATAQEVSDEIFEYIKKAEVGSGFVDLVIYDKVVTIAVSEIETYTVNKA